MCTSVHIPVCSCSLVRIWTCALFAPSQIWQWMCIQLGSCSIIYLVWECRAIDKVLPAKDYALILWMPETGNTSTMAHAVKALSMRGSNIHGTVLAPYMAKPPGWKYQSGMYLFVKCPDLSLFSDYYLSVIIRTLGDWTTKLKKRFEKLLSHFFYRHLPAGLWGTSACKTEQGNLMRIETKSAQCQFWADTSFPKS